MDDITKNNSQNMTWDYVKDDDGNYTLIASVNPTDEQKAQGITGYDMNVTDYVRNRVNGKPFYKTIGDSDAMAREMFEGFEKELPQDTKLTDQSNPEDIRQYNVNHDEKLKEIAMNPENWAATLGNQDKMQSVFPNLLDKVTKAANDPNNPDPYARELLYGAQGKEGGGDDLTDIMADNDAKMGYWVSDPNWKNRDKLDKLAVYGFNLSAPKGTYKGKELVSQTLNPAFEDTDAYKMQKMKNDQADQNNWSRQQVAKINASKGNEKKEAFAVYAKQLNSDLMGIPDSEEGDQMMIDLLTAQLPTRTSKNKQGDEIQVSPEIEIDAEGYVVIDGKRSGIKKNKHGDSKYPWAGSSNVGAIGKRNEVGGDYAETLKEIDVDVTNSNPLGI